MGDTTKKIAFLLGREHEICLEELKSVLSRFCFSFSASARRRRDWSIFRISGNIVFANMENASADDLRHIMQALGGTIKIFELVGSLGNNITNQVAELIIRERGDAGNKVDFGISCFNRKFTRQQINSFALGAKKKLKGKISLRFVEAKDNLELSSIQTLKNDLDGKGLEFGVFDEEIGILISLNNPEEWNKRDYGKPASDKYSGMVPPKLARMMVNLALGQIEMTKSKCQITNKNQNDKNSKQNVILNESEESISNIMIAPSPRQVGTQDDNMQLNNFEIGNSDFEIPQHELLVVDPFCGSGNVLMEAIMLGCDVVGSDISEKAVKDSEQNIEWLKQEITKSKLQISNKIQNPKSKLFVADAASNSLIENWKLETGNCNNVVVVTEPFLGEPKKFKPSYNSARGEYDKIKRIYLSFLKNISSVILSDSEESISNRMKDPSALPQDDTIVICLVFPLIETEDMGQFSLYKDSVDEIKELGYTQVRPTMIYGREYQIVKREIVLLQLKQNVKTQITNVK